MTVLQHGLCLQGLTTPPALMQLQALHGRSDQAGAFGSTFWRLNSYQHLPLHLVVSLRLGAHVFPMSHA